MQTVKKGSYKHWDLPVKINVQECESLEKRFPFFLKRKRSKIEIYCSCVRFIGTLCVSSNKSLNCNVGATYTSQKIIINILGHKYVVVLWYT